MSKTRAKRAKPKAPKHPDGSVLERKFAAAWRMAGGPEPVREHRFAAGRRFRFDFCWPDKMVAVELEGGIWTGGGHTRGAGYRENCEKYNLAAIQGWRVLRYTVNDLDERPVVVVEEVKSLLNAA